MAVTKIARDLLCNRFKCTRTESTMSTSVTVNDPGSLQDAMERLRSDDANTENYVLVDHHQGNPNVITLQSEGNGVDNMAAELDHTKVQYAMVRMQEQFDISTTVKFVYIHW